LNILKKSLDINNITGGIIDFSITNFKAFQSTENQAYNEENFKPKQRFYNSKLT
jgi:hypothetical protein